MPNTKSAKKALRQSARRKTRNLEHKKVLKETLKSYKKIVLSGDMKKAAEQLPIVYKTLDKAAKTKLIKKNKASRLKSRLTKKISSETKKA